MPDIKGISLLTSFFWVSTTSKILFLGIPRFGWLPPPIFATHCAGIPIGNLPTPRNPPPLPSHPACILRSPCKDRSHSCFSLAKPQPWLNPTTHLFWVYTLRVNHCGGTQPCPLTCFVFVMTNLISASHSCSGWRSFVSPTLQDSFTTLVLPTASIPMNTHCQLQITPHASLGNQIQLNINNLIFPPLSPPIYLPLDPLLCFQSHDKMSSLLDPTPSCLPKDFWPPLAPSL